MGSDSLYPGESDYLAAQAAEIIATVLEKETGAIGTDLRALQIDSLAMLDILAALEERFDIILNENIIKEFRTIYDIARIVKESIRAR